MKKTKRMLLHSAIAMLLCISMLAGSTYAWFSKYVTSGRNIITSGNLDLEMYWTDDLDSGVWHNVEDDEYNTIFNYDNWEPGYTDVKYIKLVNVGELAFNYKLSIDPQGSVGKLAEVINVYYANDKDGIAVESREDLDKLTSIGLLNEVMSGGATANGVLLADGETSPIHDSGDTIITIAMTMITTAGNEYMGKDAGDFTITAIATQAPYEKDSFGDDYDSGLEFPTVLRPGKATVDVTPVDGKVPAGGVALVDGNIAAIVPEGTLLADGTDKLTLTVTPLEKTTSDITVVNNEVLIPVDVHIDGIADNNTTPIVIDLGVVLPKYLNMGNYHLYHVEDGVNQEMTLVSDKSALVAHNQFTYDPNTGAVSVSMASFSEVVGVVDTVNAWGGEYDYQFGGTGTATDPYIISTADELAGLAQIVGGMDGQTQDSYTDKYIKLISDINLGYGVTDHTYHMFTPIGYYYDADHTFDDGTEGVYSTVNSFEGTFDGNGHTISNFYQNTWEIKGDYDAGYYNDGMGLFGYVLNGTVKNLTVNNFSSDGEFAPTGVIAAYAVNSTFENIAITNCNPRVYNTGNGGIVGIGGNSDDPDTYKLTFNNITIDNTNKITALWGSWDVACGGLVGMFRGTGHAYMTNCHVAAQIDVYNDVCGNYQYYWYRYSGMMIGTNKNMITDADGYTVPETSKFHATNCTVHFGDWNDYYYCELVANTLASYTHDHQFSRLEQIQNVSEIQDGSGNWNKAGNFILMNGKTPTETCYHIVNKDGVLKEHKHADAGEETVNGESVLKENNQRIYLPFNQLFTGYGWGVKHIPVYNGDSYAFEGITILDREVADSVEKFETKFTGDFLYRVGNQNTVSIGSLFTVISDYNENSNSPIKVNKNSNVFVSVEKVNENMNVSGVYSADTSDWTKGTIKFSGTGIVRITIQDYNFCKPTELIVEVVDATNITEAKGTTSGGNFVLLCDVNTSNYVYYWNSTVYGNGFTYSLKGAPTNYSSSHGHGVIMTQNTTLDNLKIVGDEYNAYGAYTNQDYYNAAIDVTGDTVIQNCYISGCSSPVNVRSNVTIKNTTLYGGAVANLMIKSGTVTLEDVTTVNYADGRKLVGMGIVAHSDVTESAKLIINGTLKQHNFINENNIPSDSNAKILYNAMFDNACSKYHFDTDDGKYVNTGVISMSTLFNASDITDNANTGYVGSTVSVNSVNGYVYTQPNTSGSVNNDYDEENDTSIGNTQGSVPPTYSFDYTTKNYIAKTEGSNDYCYEENGIVKISMDVGDSFEWDSSILTVKKGNKTLSYTVAMNGVDYTGKSITFNTAGDYEVVYTYTDSENFKYGENGEIVKYDETYHKSIYINVAVIKETTKHAEFTMGSSNVATEKINVDNATYISATGVTADNSTWSYITINGQKIYYPIVAAKLTSTKGSSTYAYFPVFENVVSITDYANGGTGDAFTYNSSTTTLPSNLTAVKGIYKAASDVPYWYNLTNSNLTQSGASKIFKWASSSDAPSAPTTYNNVLCYKSPQISADRVAYITLVQYSYTDEANTTYYYYVGYTLEAFTKQTTCVTSDTLVTLADGAQKRIDEVTYSDKLLVWNFYEGKYDVAPVAIIFDHGADNNTVIKLSFNDGTEVKVVNMHQFFNADLNKLVTINADTVDSYVGHKFAKRDGNETIFVELESYSITNEYVEAWGVMSGCHYNIITEDMISADFDLKDVDLFNYFEIDEGMKFDEAKMKADIEKYGLYTYDDFAEYLTYEQFVAFNVQYFKIPVSKGLYTYDGILELIDQYLN